MITFQQFKICLTKPTLFKPYKHIILLSHMRANTSLFGHILGSHDEIEGYYEMHIGYYSWRSLIHQKLVYFKDHAVKTSAKYIFDKVLHSEHAVKTDVLAQENVIPIISIRAPEQTIPSIVKLYEKVDPSHEFCSIKGATKYYLSRLATLEKIALSDKVKYIYLDAEALREKTDQALSFLTSILSLSSPLTSTYTKQKLTGKGNTGDHSANLTAGKIKTDKTDYSSYHIPENLLRELNECYESTRETLIKNCQHRLMSM